MQILLIVTREAKVVNTIEGEEVSKDMAGASN